MDLKFILEAILFSAQKPLSLKELRDVFAAAVEHAEGNETVRGLKKVKEEQLTAALEELSREHDAVPGNSSRSRIMPHGSKRWSGTKPGHPGFRSRHWRRSPSSRTGSRSRGPRSNKCAGWLWTA
jgi:hypothetical protein